MAYKDPKDPRLKEARDKWYRENKDKQIQRQIERKKEIVRWARELKTKCNRCGFDNPIALVFHHIDPSQKDLNVSVAISRGWSKEKILTEIEKCEVVCANCHAIEHQEG